MTIKTQKIGIDLGSYEIKIANLSKTGKEAIFGPSLKFKAVGEIGEKRYFRSLKKNIQAYVEHYDYDKIELFFTISPNINGATSATIMSLPATEKKVLEKAIKFEAEEQGLIDNLANHHYMWDTIETITEEDSIDGVASTKLLLTTINRDIIFEIAQLRTIKWSVERVELQVNTLGRGIEDNSVVIDLGHKSSMIYLYEKGKLQEIDTLDFNGDRLNVDIQAIHSTPSYKLAEELKHKSDIKMNDRDSFGSVHGDLIRMTSETLLDESEQVISEIKRIIRGFEFKDPLDMVNIDTVYFTGSGIKLTGLSELLEESFEYEMRPLYDSIGIDKTNAMEVFEENAFQRSETKANEQKNDKLEDLSIKLKEVKTVVYEKLNIKNAEAEKEIYKESDVLTDKNVDSEIYFASSILSTLESEDELNLDYQKHLKYKFDYSSILIMTTAMAATLMLGIIPIDKAYGRNINNLNESLQMQNVEVGDLETSRSELDSKKQENEKLKNRVDSLTDEKKWFSEVLYEIPEITPKEVIVEHVNINSGIVTIKGYSKDYTDIGAFAIGLESLGEYEIKEIGDVDSSDKHIGKGLDSDERKSTEQMSQKFEMTLVR